MILLKLDRDKYINHIQDKDQIINSRKLLDKIEIVYNRHIVQSTDFLDPYERRVSISILNQFQDINYREYGGIGEAERKIILIYPDYLEYSDFNIPLNFLKIYDYAGRFSHRDFLGSILALGINREKVGDILIHENHTQVIVKEEISDFILLNLHKISRENIKIVEIPENDLETVEVIFKEHVTTVSSLRLDAIISGALNVSRNDSQKLINSGLVKVNWEPIVKLHYELEAGDMVSIRGYGRFVLYRILGKSKKNRFRVNIRLIK